MYEFIKKVKRFEVKWPENCTAEWVGNILKRRLTVGAFDAIPPWDDDTWEIYWEHGIVAEFDGEEIVAEWYDTSVVSDLEELAARTNYAVAVTEKGVTIDGHVAPRDLNGRPACLIRHRDGSRQWMTFSSSVDALAEEMGAEAKAVFPEREIHNPGEVRADWWSRDVAEARW